MTTGESSGGEQLFSIYKSPKANDDWGVVTLSERHDGLVEYVSRSARIKLIRILIDHLGSTRAVARELKISAKAVWNWITTNSTHPSNYHLRCVLQLAIKMDRERILDILEEDLLKHQTALHRLEKSRVNLV